MPLPKRPIAATGSQVGQGDVADDHETSRLRIFTIVSSMDLAG
jgi:hypothetical protein